MSLRGHAPSPFRHSGRVLLQLRVTVPPDRTAQVRDLFAGDAGTAHLSVLAGASVMPAGDLVVAEVARESADGLIGALKRLGIDEDGGIVWEQVVRTTDAESTLSASYLAFLTIATLLAAAAIINDSAILVIGAMVLGPEFAPLAALAVAVVHRRPSIARRAAVSLTVGFALAIAVTALAVLAGRALGWFGTEVLTAERPETRFITQPDRWSVVVAVLAGIAGVLSLTAARSGALVGVFISVTTVPAAADMAVALALGGSSEFVRAATQLGINLAGILTAALATLALQKAVWHRMPRVVPAIERVRGSS